MYKELDNYEQWQLAKYGNVLQSKSSTWNPEDDEEDEEDDLPLPDDLDDVIDREGNR